MSTLLRILATELTPKKNLPPVSLQDLKQRITLEVPLGKKGAQAGTETVKARKINKYLALHRSVAKPKLWDITHIPTKLAMTHKPVDLEAAKIYMNGLIKLGSALNFSDPDKVPPKVLAVVKALWTQIS